MAEYGSSESGASLGDILGAAFTKAAAERKPEAKEDQKRTKSQAEKSCQEGGSQEEKGHCQR